MGGEPVEGRGTFWVPVEQGDGMMRLPCTWLVADDGTPIAIRLHCPRCGCLLMAQDHDSRTLGLPASQLLCPGCARGHRVAVASLPPGALFDFIREAIAADGAGQGT